MADTTPPLPDFSSGFSIRDLPDGGKVLGRVDQEEVLLVRTGDAVFAVGPHCTHYHGPLVDGLVVGDTIRCPWHHACFSLATGEAVRAPALDPIPCWRVERIGDLAYVRKRTAEAPGPARPSSSSVPTSIVIVGGGAAGLAAADVLRRERYDGPITMLTADDSPPVDRPNLSKDFLAGTAQEDWIPLRSPDFYSERRIELVLNARVTSLDANQESIHLENGQRHSFGALLIATGAEPIHLDIPGATSAQTCYLRTFSDSRAIVAKAASAKSVVVVGASFIGLEVAASLRARGIGIHVVAPESQPLERVMGPEVGEFIRRLHEEHGVVFHLGSTVRRVDGQVATLTDGTTLDADFLVLGVGVRPAIDLAEQAGLSRTIRRSAVLLESALRRDDQLRRSCRAVGSNRDRGVAGCPRLRGYLHARGTEACSRDDVTRLEQFASGGADGGTDQHGWPMKRKVRRLSTSGRPRCRPRQTLLGPPAANCV